MAEEVEKYLVSHAPLVGPGPPPSEPMGKKAKGSSRPPVGTKAFAFWEANRIAADFIEWRVGDITKHNNAYNGIQFSELVTELYRNPAISQAWKAGENQSAAVSRLEKQLDQISAKIRKTHRELETVKPKEKGKRKEVRERLEAQKDKRDVVLDNLEAARYEHAHYLQQEAFEKMCRLIAQDILACNPGASFFVTVNPKPLKDLDEEDDATPLIKSGAKHHRNRRYTYEHTARKRYERVKEIQATENCTKTAAVAMMADENDIGIATAWRCIEFCENADARAS